MDDAVDALVRAAERGDGLLVNVGTGVETTVNDLYALMAAAAGVDRPPSRRRAAPASWPAPPSTRPEPPSSSAGAPGPTWPRAPAVSSTGSSSRLSAPTP